MGGSGKSKVSQKEFQQSCDLTLDPSKKWTALGDADKGDDDLPMPPSVKTWDATRQIYIQQGTTWGKEFEQFLLILQKNLPQQSRKLSQMWANAQAAEGIVVTHQKKIKEK